MYIHTHPRLAHKILIDAFVSIIMKPQHRREGRLQERCELYNLLAESGHESVSPFTIIVYGGKRYVVTTSHLAMIPVFQVIDGEIHLVYQGLYLRELEQILVEP